MLSLKGSLVKEAFAAAEKKLIELDDDRYSAFLCSLLSDALSGLMESERTIVCYDTEGEYSQVDKVIITVGEDDRRFSGALERQARAILGNSGKNRAGLCRKGQGRTRLQNSIRSYRDGMLCAFRDIRRIGKDERRRL